ncbi:MAG: hypothetical protein JXA99_01990 [Candidatus Lokiarchaeota archaeon]|nr:hypothetical protein [Candidatus Lokiarchaeota archaeon]
MKKSSKENVENKMLTDLNDFMLRFGIDEITFGKNHSIKRTKDKKAKAINKKKK